MIKNNSSSLNIQNIASDPKNNVYLAASAGTGKTKTLVDRILKLLLNNEKIEHILCLTFTNVAAGEMMQRLKDELKKWHLINDNKLKEYLLILLNDKVTNNQILRAKELYNHCLDNLDKFRIQTLHSFCVDLLNQLKFLDEDNIDDLKIIDDYSRKKLMENALDRVINSSKHKLEVDIALIKVSVKYDYYSLLNLLKDVLYQKQKVFEFINSKASIKDLINEQYEFYNTKSVSKTELLNKFFNNTDTEFRNVLNICEKDDVLNIIFNWIEGDNGFKEDNFHDYLNCFLTKAMLPRSRIPFDKKIREDNPDLIEQYKAEQIRIIEFLEKKSSQEQAELMQAIIIILNEVIIEYEKLKHNFGYLEYDDLIIETLEALNKVQDIEAFLYFLNLAFNHILIDEAQDISKFQWDLIEKIIRSIYSYNSSIFIVGDYKQSIYGFQGADPEYFLQVNKFYKTEFIKLSKSWDYLELNYSFRSKKEILYGVDQVFNSISFIDKLKHIAIKEGKGIVKIIEHLPNSNKVVKKDEGWKIPKKDDEYINTKFLNSQEISNFIINLLNQKNTSEKKIPKDIMVLFRKRCEKMKYLKDSLKQNNVPVSDSCKINFSDDLIILDLLAIVKFFLLPEDNLNLVSLLKSVFFKFSEKDIFKLSFDRNNQNIWDRVQIFYPEVAKELIKFKCDFEEESLHGFYNKLLYSYKFIKNFYQEFGRNCHEIIDIFLEKVSEFEKLLLGNKQIFIEWIQDNSEIILDNSNLDGIKLMTVHSAKGLQSPIVILADAGDSENMPNESYFWYKNNLIISNFNEYKSKKIHQIQNERKNELKKESLRLLYVAMTRAESELYIFGEGKNKKDSWFNIAKNALGENFIKYSDLKIKEPKYIFDKLECEDNNIPNYFNENYVSNAVEQNDIASTKEQIFSDIAVIRGNFIHKILCDIAKICKTDIEEYITSLAYDDNFDLLPKNDVNEIIQITADILKKFPNIFARNVFSEVSIANLAKNSKAILKIDKLIIKEKQIEIIEIKTDKSKAISKNNIPSEYSKQLNIYKRCVSNIYSNKKVICKILSFYQKEIIIL